MEQKPSVGRIVHYRALGSSDGKFPAGECRAAIITAVADNPRKAGDMPQVTLCVLNPTGMYFNEKASYDDQTTAGGTWHWPERV